MNYESSSNEHQLIMHGLVIQANGRHHGRIPRPPGDPPSPTTRPVENLHDQPQVRPKRTPRIREFKIVALRETPVPDDLIQCDTPERAVAYWHRHIATNPYFNPDCECCAVLLLNTRRRVRGHQLITFGTIDSMLVHPREVYRSAVIAAAAAVIVMHNHPSGEATPSEADIRTTRDLIRAGQLLKIDLLDHVIVGNKTHCSLRSLGHFHV